MLFDTTKKITVDAAAFADPKTVHAVLKEALDSEAYLGNNLDALSDVLTTLGRKTKLTVVHYAAAEKALGEYAARLALVLASAASANPRLTVEFR